MAKAPEVGLFGVALPPNAEPTHSDDDTAHYRAKVRPDDVIAFYQAVYGKTEGLELAVVADKPPRHIAITSGKKCPDAEFGLICAVEVAGEEKLVDIIITRRGAEDEEGYDDSSPWRRKGPPK